MDGIKISEREKNDEIKIIYYARNNNQIREKIKWMVKTRILNNHYRKIKIERKVCNLKQNFSDDQS